MVFINLKILNQNKIKIKNLPFGVGSKHDKRNYLWQFFFKKKIKNKSFCWVFLVTFCWGFSWKKRQENALIFLKRFVALQNRRKFVAFYNRHNSPSLKKKMKW